MWEYPAPSPSGDITGMSHGGHQSLQGDGSPVTHSDNGLDDAHVIIYLPLSVLVPHLRIWRLLFSSLPNKLLALEIVSLPPLWGGVVCFWELPIETDPSASDPVDPSIICLPKKLQSLFYFSFPLPQPYSHIGSPHGWETTE